MEVKPTIANPEFVEGDNIKNYWKDLERIKMLTPHQYNKSKGAIRQGINRALAVGLSIVNPVTGEKSKRHVLSANEIKRQVESRTNLSLGKSNLYFHLQELVKLDLVQIIDIAVSNKGRGKKYSAYYGRTAKLFRFEANVNRDKEEIKLLYQPEFRNLIRDLNPKISSKDINEMLGLIKKVNLVDNSPFFSWLKIHETDLNTNNIDLNEFCRMSIFLHMYDPEVLEGISRLKRYLKLDSNNNYIPVN